VELVSYLEIPAAVQSLQAVVARSWKIRLAIIREPRRWGTSAVESSYQETAIEDATVDTSVFVIVKCKV
jgi:hypothetical protein